jgi:hypothetical protein
MSGAQPTNSGLQKTPGRRRPSFPERTGFKFLQFVPPGPTDSSLHFMYGAVGAIVWRRRGRRRRWRRLGHVRWCYNRGQGHPRRHIGPTVQIIQRFGLGDILGSQRQPLDFTHLLRAGIDIFGGADPERKINLQAIVLPGGKGSIFGNILIGWLGHRRPCSSLGPERPPLNEP